MMCLFTLYHAAYNVYLYDVTSTEDGPKMEMSWLVSLLKLTQILYRNKNTFNALTKSLYNPYIYSLSLTVCKAEQKTPLT